MKRVVVPAATPSEVEASIQLDAEQYIPFELTEVNLDYQVVGPGLTQAEEPGMEVVLVAAKKDKIQNHTNVISLAGQSVTGLVLSRWHAGADGMLNECLATRTVAIASRKRSSRTPFGSTTVLP